MILGFNYIQNLYNEASPKTKMSSVLFRLKANYVSDLSANILYLDCFCYSTTVNQRI